MKTLHVWPNEGALLKISDDIYRMLNIESPSYVLQKVISQIKLCVPIWKKMTCKTNIKQKIKELTVFNETALQTLANLWQ